MNPISATDRLVMVLRQKLEERARSGTRRAQSPDSKPHPGGRATVQALAAIGEADDRQLRRALIQSILAEHFGAEMLNEAKFQQVVDRVTEAMAEDCETGALLDRLVGELRSAAR